ncbi:MULTISPECIES: MFS transporter [Kitasatospora]|uniref:Putative major facilitator superfamily transporter n=1 Tax=Kitasatospora setae (strain ATCC 33774 / DSM 43861 / JCM 3304 / KCC A-0304 / NBRC 14216 / KM-6054) TaxID=452652 RepID=E4N3K3_KITSK|nr:MULTISPECIES: MFS transporter [Kitasatospora]BAJ31484.1 putative major facilitator superfamily transporter [Kitasatospora setae KM-6054]
MPTAAEPSATETGSRPPTAETPAGAPVDAPAGVRARAEAPARNAAAVLLAVAVAAAAVNLRPVVTSLGALLDPVRDGLGMSATMAGLLAAVPPLCFAVLGICAPALARRLGPIAVVTAALAAITAGVLARSFTGSAVVFLLLTALALAGVALANVLIPVVIKRYFPDRVAPMIGLYSMALSVGTSLAAATTVPLTNALGGDWRLGLGVWGLLALAALALWLVVLFARRERGAASSPAAGPHVKLPILRSRTAWALAFFFGLQSTSAYSAMGWLPKIYHDAGVSESASGVLLALVMAVSVPVSFLLPNLAARRGDQRLYVVVLGLCGIAGFLGLMLAAGTVPWLWAVLVGLSMCAFPLALTMLGLRARTPGGVTQLSAFAQSLGYLISIPGPILMGALYQSTGQWYLPLGLLALLLVPQMLVGLRAARARHIEDEAVG